MFCNLEVDLLHLKEYLYSKIIEEINRQFDLIHVAGVFWCLHVSLKRTKLIRYAECNYWRWEKHLDRNCLHMGLNEEIARRLSSTGGKQKSACPH